MPTHIQASAGIWWYVGTVHQPHTWQQYGELVDPNGMPPPSWVYHYSGLGHASIWADAVAIGKQYLFSFYWSASTLSASALVGDTTPKNIAEVVVTVGCAAAGSSSTEAPLTLSWPAFERKSATGAWGSIVESACSVAVPCMQCAGQPVGLHSRGRHARCLQGDAGQPHGVRVRHGRDHEHGHEQRRRARRDARGDGPRRDVRFQAPVPFRPCAGANTRSRSTCK